MRNPAGPQMVPHLARLLGPTEDLVHVPRLHPVYGWPWLLGACACAGLAVATGWWGVWLLAALLVGVYRMPFITNEMAITTHRVLLRKGRFTLALNDLAPDHIHHYQLHQNPLTHLLGTGRIILNLTRGKELVALELPPLRRPLEFIEALGTLNPHVWGES